MWKLMGRTVLGGIGIGSFMYLLVVMLGVQTTAPTPRNISSVWVMSALISLLSLIFNSDRWSFLALLAVHLGGTAGIVAVAIGYNHWSDLLTEWSYWLVFLLIYVAVWAIIYVDQALRVSRINKALADRRKNRA